MRAGNYISMALISRKWLRLGSESNCLSRCLSAMYFPCHFRAPIPGSIPACRTGCGRTSTDA